MSNSNMFGGLIDGGLLSRLRVRTPSAITLGGALILHARSEPVQILDPGGTHRDVTLPAEASSQHLMFFIVNAASSNENLLVKNDSGTVIATLAGVSGGTNNKRGIFVCDGTTWYGMHTGATG